MEKKIITIIGGGASGLIAAISAAKVLKQKNLNNIEIIILERMDRVGKKLLATGNGKCNITNINAEIKYYHSENIEFVKQIFNKVNCKDVIKFFEDIGLMCRIEKDGKVYPYSNQASSVLDILRLEIQNLGIKTICNFEVDKVYTQNNDFVIVDKNGTEQFTSKLIVSTGGKAYSNLGSNGSGYKLFKALEHNLIDTFPSLVQIKSDSQFIKALDGIKVFGEASININNKVVKKEKGEILFTDYGLSGIAIMQLSRIVSEYFLKSSKNNIAVTLDIMPEYSEQAIISLIQKRVVNQGWKTLEDFLTGIINKRVAQMILKSANISPLSRLAETLTRQEIINIAKFIKGWTFQITGTMPFRNAQVTAGGVDTKYFNSSNLESRLVKNLYATGELLDVDGDCGGYNLQWAWATGIIAGKSAANSI